MPAFRCVQEQVAQEEEKPNDEPQSCREEFERDHRIFTDNGGEQNPHQRPGDPVGERVAEEALIHWEAAHGP